MSFWYFQGRFVITKLIGNTLDENNYDNAIQLQNSWSVSKTIYLQSMFSDNTLENIHVHAFTNILYEMLSPNLSYAF